MKCCDCKYWEKRENSLRGVCRFKAPEFNIQGVGIWPETHGTEDWCSNLRRNPEHTYTSKYRRHYGHTITEISAKYKISAELVCFKHETGSLKTFIEAQKINKKHLD